MKEPALLLFLILCFIYSCTTTQSNQEQEESMTETLPILTAEQQTAFDILNQLQLDSKGHLYSTFADIDHPCYPPDTNFIITQAELQLVLLHLLDTNCPNLSIEQRTELATAAVLPQEKYLVKYCYDTSSEQVENGNRMTGTWVLPNILGRRDVVIEW